MHLGAKEVDLPVSSTVRHSEKQVFGGWDMLRCFLGENVSLSLEPGEEFHANEVWDTRKKIMAMGQGLELNGHYITVQGP